MLPLLRYFRHAFVICAVLNSIRPSPFAEADTRCYDNLGCFDSGIFHALPQDPSFVRTTLTGSCKGHVNDVIIRAFGENETQWRKDIDNSSLDTSLETVFIIHGFTDSSSAGWVARMRDAFLLNRDYNVFALDWSHGAQFPYEQAVANSFLVARQLAAFMDYLERVHGLSPVRVHLVGHSLGAQIAGNAGNDLKTSRVARISGLDPAEPLFSYLNDSMRLDASDAMFVDVIHTDGETFSGFHGYGSLRAQGHVDFFPNGGVKQPGCNDPNAPFGILSGEKIQQAIACSHARAIDLFIASLEPVTCVFTSHPCPSWAVYDQGGCPTDGASCPQQVCPSMGFHASSKLKGSYYLSTSADEPYCGHSYIVAVTTTEGQGHSYGRLLMSLNGTHGTSNSTELNRANHHYHKNESDTHVITVTSDVGNVTSVLLEFNKGRGLSALGTSDDLHIAFISVSSLDHKERWGSEPSTLKDTKSPIVTLHNGDPAWVGLN